MQKPNLKYFIGSFFLSLVAVFIATKAYIVMNLSTQQSEQDINAVEAKNIELFAANEENDPIFEKYKRLTAAEAPLGASSEVVVQPTADTKVFAEQNETSDTILYAADDSANWISGDENFAEAPTEDILSTDFSTENATHYIRTAEENSDNEELQITDAKQAPNFTIPLKHNFKIETGVVSVSDEADSSHIALASQNVSIYNLGTDNTAAVTEPLSADEEEETVAQDYDVETYENVDTTDNENNPWEVAEAANKHVTKNTYGVKSETLQHDVDLPDAEVAQEKQMARKPPQNILIPVPEDILNDENLTPQFSTSEENLRIEQELRDSHKLPELLPEERIGNTSSSTGQTTVGGGVATTSESGVIPSIDDERDFDNEGTDANADTEDDRTSQSYSDSVASWFDGIKTKITGTKPLNSPAGGKQNGKDKHSSIFQRLLGSRGPQDIVPTELKLAFQPNRAEISGQTLDWLHAFADNAVQNDNVVVEIRVDRSASYEVQKKRLKLLYKILADNGVESNKVNIIFTDREPNSFIIRNVRYASDEERIEAVRHSNNPWN